MAPGNIYHSMGSPVRNINMLPMVKIAPAMPPPTAIFAELICGRGVSSNKLASGFKLPQIQMIK
jgi:hypothetical protein